MRFLRFLVLAVAVVLATIGTAKARLMHAPSYQGLFDKSDLVVIATPVATRDTTEQIDLPGVTLTMADNTTVGFPVIGVETRFRVAAVLKGRKTLKEFVLHHYREAQSQPVINGPWLIAFDPSKKTSFLLFVVREMDGRYAPTSGQTDPGFVSVHTLGPCNK